MYVKSTKNKATSINYGSKRTSMSRKASNCRLISLDSTVSPVNKDAIFKLEVYEGEKSTREICEIKVTSASIDIRMYYFNQINSTNRINK